MHSETRKRQRHVQILKSALEAQDSANEQGAAISEAIRECIEIASQPPAPGTPCELTLRIWQESLTMQRADCSECGATVLGFESFWKYAPCCGASITKVTTETDPRQRLERAAVQEAVNQLTGAR
jgi:hypothetical protein